MREYKHTPGPWYWCDGEDKKDLPYLTSNAGKICEFGNWEAYYPQCGELPNEADARLIAAAPELLEALQGILDEDMEDSKRAAFWGGFVLPDDLRQEARAAIAKAKGETL